MTFRPLAAVAALVACFAQPAAALTINLSQKSGDSLSADQSAAFRTAADTWSAFLGDNIAVNVQVGFTTLGSGVLGATTPMLNPYSRAALTAAVSADARSQADAQAVQTFGTATSNTIYLTAANAKALGLGSFAAGSIDGTIEFSDAYSFSTSRDAAGGVAAGTFDLIGIAEHEIGHLLGFVSGVDYGPNFQTMLDQFRYAAPGLRGHTSGDAAYFSFDKGVTDVADFSTGSGNQASHWKIGTTGVMVPEVGAGQVQNLGALDILAMDVIGYDVAVPEPWSVGLLLMGTLGAGAVHRRRAGAVRV